jgi:hypothetical protein
MREIIFLVALGVLAIAVTLTFWLALKFSDCPKRHRHSDRCFCTPVRMALGLRCSAD